MTRITRSIEEIKEFGWNYFIRYRLVGRIKGRSYKQHVTLEYLRQHYSWICSTDLTPMYVQPNPHPNTIWVCWWQGETQMPEIVKACYSSLKKHCNGHHIILITKDNYRQYVEFPTWVEQKFTRGKITITHLSDLLRLALLTRYGGLWMDSTLYLTADLPKDLPFFFTLKQKEDKNDIYISRHRWTGFCLGGQVENPLWRIAYEILLNEYWKKHDHLINYYILDYAIDIIYENNAQVRQLIDYNEYSNPDLAFFSSKCNDEFDEDTWKHITSRTSIFKLSWKGNILKTTSDNKLTYNGYIMKNI